MSKKHLNPDANPNNVLQISESAAGCCPSDLKVCQSTVVGPEATPLTEVLIEGAEPFILETPATTDAEIQAAILAAIVAAGYIQIEAVTVTVVDGIPTITHTGEAHIETLTFGETVVDGEILCDSKYVCDYQADGNDDLVLTWMDNEYPVGTFVAGTDAPADVEAAILAVIEANPDLAFIESVVVTLNEDESAYTVQYTSCQPQCGTVGLGEREFLACLCETRFFPTEEDEKVKEKIKRLVAEGVAKGLKAKTKAKAADKK